MMGCYTSNAHGIMVRITKVQTMYVSRNNLFPFSDLITLDFISAMRPTFCWEEGRIKLS